jgi:uncharacterized protein (TIGR00369 family)
MENEVILDEARAGWNFLEQSYVDSAIHSALGLTLEIVGAGEAIVRYDGAAAAGNRQANVAGGALAEMIDSAVAQAARSLFGSSATVVTSNLTVHFLRPGRPREPLLARGSVEFRGASSAVGQGRIVNSEGQLVAIGFVTVKKVGSNAR